MNILVVGSGAREHALAWKLAQSKAVGDIFVAPGNAGTTKIANNVAVDPEDIGSLLALVRRNDIGLTVVGPEGPLSAGIVDEFVARGMKIFGPTRKASLIEGSKVFSKRLMHKYGIPCANSRSFDSYADAQSYLDKQPTPIVIKADGLAAGKGVVVAQTREEAQKALSEMMQFKSFGIAGERVVIEEYLEGREMSAFAVSDGESVAAVAYACDYKRILDGDRGPNTGGMGSFSPPDIYSNELGTRIMEQVLKPVITAMQREGVPYTGVLYAGLMVKDSNPRVIEFNARLGDPETQVILPRLNTDFLDIALAVSAREVSGLCIENSLEHCVGVVMASGGYPGNFNKGYLIEGLGDVDTGVTVFHAGTKLENGKPVTSGGRVLTVVAKGADRATARNKTYDNITRIHFQDAYFRRDIALL